MSNKDVHLFGGYFITIPVIILIVFLSFMSVEYFKQNIILLIALILILIFGIIDDNIDLKPTFKTIFSLIVFCLFITFNQKFRISGIDIYFFKYDFLILSHLFLLYFVFIYFKIQSTLLMA